MTFPTLFRVGVHTYTDSLQLDDYNELEPVYTPTKDAAGTQVAVYGWSTPDSTEPPVAGHDRVMVDMQLLAPPNTSITAHDLVDIPDEGQFEVIGDPLDFDTGPFGFRPGLVINLRRVEG